jgi:hypothetical protein
VVCPFDGLCQCVFVGGRPLLSDSAKLMSQFLKPKITGEHTGLMEPLGRRKALQVMDKLVHLLFQARVLMVSANGTFGVAPEVFQRIEVGAAGGQP